MTLTEAREECRRYLDYLATERTKSEALQRLAADRRSGKCDDKEKERRMRDIMGSGIKVYDGANLAKAIEVMLKLTEPQNRAAGGQDD
jgi:hypothetical protein